MKNNYQSVIALSVYLALTPNFGHAGFCQRVLSKVSNSPSSKDPATVRSDLSHDTEVLRQSKTLSSSERSALLLQYAKPAAKTKLDRAFVVANYALATYLSVHIASGYVESPEKLFYGALLAAPALYLSDFATQIVHKFLDCYGSESNPIWGSSVREFRHHHEVPNNLDTEDYVGSVAVPAKVMSPFFAAAAFAGMSPEWGTAVWLFLVAGMNATALHKESHKNNPQLYARITQALRLSMSHKAHMKHHQPPFDGEFSILNGWANGLSRKLKLWNKLDLIYWKWFQRMPNNWIQDPRSIPASVIAEVSKELESISPDLWDYADTYPQRTTPEVTKIVQESRGEWRKNFMDERRKIYLEQAQYDAAKAEEAWQNEQREYPWIYGEVSMPLNP